MAKKDKTKEKKGVAVDLPVKDQLKAKIETNKASQSKDSQAKSCK